MSVVYSDFPSKTPTKKVDRLSNYDLESPPASFSSSSILESFSRSSSSFSGYFPGSQPPFLSRALLLQRIQFRTGCLCWQISVAVSDNSSPSLASLHDKPWLSANVIFLAERQLHTLRQNHVFLLQLSLEVVLLEAVE